MPEPMSQIRVHGLFQALRDRDWWLGTLLEAVVPNHDGSCDRVRIVKVTSWSDIPIRKDGKYDVPADDPHHGHDGTVSGILTKCEYPPGGKVTAFSLNCRDWREVKK